MIKNPMQETWETRVQSLGWEDSLEEEMATHASILTWKTPWAEEPGGLQPMESQSRTQLSTYTCTLTAVGEGKVVSLKEFWKHFVFSYG